MRVSKYVANSSISIIFNFIVNPIPGMLEITDSMYVGTYVRLAGHQINQRTRAALCGGTYLRSLTWAAWSEWRHAQLKHIERILLTFNVG